MKNRKSKLPPYVFKDRSRFAYRKYLGVVNGKPKFCKPIRLCPADSPLSEVWLEYERLQGRSTDTLRWLLETYNASDKFKDLAKATQTGYVGYLRVICERKGKGGGEFGDMSLENITMRTMRLYLDSYNAKTTGNRHVQYIKAAWNWAVQRYDNVPVANPCMGVSLNREKARERYVSDDEYSIVFDAAMSMRVPFFAYAMELAYLCRARRSEVFAFKREDVLENGLLLRRSKGSQDEITLWSPRLRAAVDGCLTINPNAPRQLVGAPLIANRVGRAYSKNALDSAWQRVISKALANGLGQSFTYHDLKAKGVTDHKMSNAGLHKSKKMQAVYDRLPQQIPATDKYLK